MRLKYISLIATLLAILSAAWSIPSAQAAASEKVMLILDASGSRWGKVGGQSKIAIARETIRGLMRHWDKDIQIGLMAYGHRHKGDCHDIQTIYPVSVADPAAITKAVDALSPKGKTPLTAAVREGARELKYTEGKATVILVSDGRETCNADPCAAAKELEKLGVGFTVHVIGFNVKKKEQKQLKCLADNTGGRFFTANNADELNSALKTAVKQVKMEAKKIVAQAPSKPKAAVTPGHKFVAVLREGGEPLTDGVSWDIFESKATADGKRKRVNYSYDAQPLFPLSAGKYLVVAGFGSAGAKQEFGVKASGAAQRHVIVLNAGQVAVEARYADGSEMIKSGMGWDVFGVKTDLEGKHKRFGYSYDAAPTFRLPAGHFLLVATRGAAVVKTNFDITAGDRKKLVVNMNAGLLAPRAALTKESKPLAKGVGWDVYGLEKDLEGKRKRYSYSYDAAPVFTLTAGKYLLVSSIGGVIKQQKVEVTAGKRNASTVDLEAGQVKLVAKTVDGVPIKKIGWDVVGVEKDLEGHRKRFAYSYDATPIFTLAAGRYTIVATIGNQRHEAPLEVKPGDSRMVEVAIK